MSLHLSEVEEIKNVNFIAPISVAGAVTNSVVANFSQVGFRPDFIIIRSVSISTSTANNNMYVVNSDLTSDFICVFQGAQHTQTPNIIIKPQKSVYQMSLNILQADSTSATGYSSPTLAGNWYLGMSMDFVKLRKYNALDVQYKYSGK